MNDEDASTLRGLIARGVVHRVDDSRGLQQVDVETHEGVVRSDVEVLQPYGLTSAAPVGGLTVVLSIGGDHEDAVALPVASPGGRLGGLAPGEVALHDDGGNRLHLRAGGHIALLAAASVLVQVEGTVFRVTATGVAVEGDVTVNGTITATGNIKSQAQVHDGAGNVRS